MDFRLFNAWLYPFILRKYVKNKDIKFYSGKYISPSVNVITYLLLSDLKYISVCPIKITLKMGKNFLMPQQWENTKRVFYLFVKYNDMTN